VWSPRALRRLLNPSVGPAFEPLISREARSLVPSQGRILFGVSPFPGPCCKREEEGKKEKDTKLNDVAYLFFYAVIMAKAKRRSLLLPEARLSRRGVNATGRVVRGVAVARARAVRGMGHGALSSRRERGFSRCPRMGRELD
jgi:hypothetical protein